MGPVGFLVLGRCEYDFERIGRAQRDRLWESFIFKKPE